MVAGVERRLLRTPRAGAGHRTSPTRSSTRSRGRCGWTNWSGVTSRTWSGLTGGPRTISPSRATRVARDDHGIGSDTGGPARSATGGARSQPGGQRADRRLRCDARARTQHGAVDVRGSEGPRDVPGLAGYRQRNWWRSCGWQVGAMRPTTASRNWLTNCRAVSRDFARFWAERDLFQHTHGPKRFHHDAVGTLTVNYETMHLPADPGLSLILYTAEPGSASEAKLRELVAVAR